MRTGRLHTTERGCALVLQRDLLYWGLDDMSMEPCCALKYFPELDVCQSEKDGDLDAKKKASSHIYLDYIILYLDYIYIVVLYIYHRHSSGHGTS